MRRITQRQFKLIIELLTNSNQKPLTIETPKPLKSDKFIPISPFDKPPPKYPYPLGQK
tara:strand:+ start:78 stop:251 length:174 start_codon:yes stop_codon:yes gene_type:complete